ncbi:MAG TPA: FAD-dependent oxidoreductase [Desulfuromonadaceae bacterium]|jgi:protoporphyrinogen oxidase
MKILILGAGPCGLGAAYHLNQLGHKRWQLFERNDYVGGLSASFLDNIGFTWDVGGHVLFSHYDYFDKVVTETLGDTWYEHQRESWVRLLETWVPYPFQNNVRYLPDEALLECVTGLRDLQSNDSQTFDFNEWMRAAFGAGIVKYFMEPYNRKVWGVPLETMSKGWIAERVSVVDLARIERNIAEQCDDLSWGPNNTFKFPKRGGTGTIYDGIARSFHERIHLNHEMHSVDLEAKQVRFTNGKVESYDTLINTAPLDVFVKACVTIPDALVSATDGLIHNGGLIVGLGFEERRDDTKCWMYFPESNSPFYRVTNFHNYSPFNVPGGDINRYSSLMCETTYSSHKPEDKLSIVDETIRGLVNSGMINDAQRKRIISRYMIDIPYSYPVPTLGRDKALSVIQPYLESRNVYSRGRFGAWKYEVANMDHSFMQGVEVVERILLGKDEQTVNGQIG